MQFIDFPNEFDAMMYILAAILSRFFTNFYTHKEWTSFFMQNCQYGGMGKFLPTAWHSCWLFTDGGGVTVEDDPDSSEKPGPIWPLAFLASALSEHGFTWHCLNMDLLGTVWKFYCEDLLLIPKLFRMAQYQLRYLQSMWFPWVQISDMLGVCSMTVYCRR